MMTKNYFYLILLINIQLLYSQQYETIVDVNKKWNIKSTSFNVGGSLDEPPEYINTDTYRIGGEFSFNGITYHSVLKNGIITNKYIRENTVNNVYLYDVNTNNETLIYNFNLVINDEISILNFFEETEVWKVINIENVFFAGNNRKKISLQNVENTLTEEWYEGIGSLKGLIFPIFNVIDFDKSLLCYYNNNERLYLNGNSCNESTYSISDVSFFLDNTFELLHFLIDDNTIEYPTGGINSYFSVTQGDTNNKLNITINGLCGNTTTATILLNDDNSITVLERGNTTLASCNPQLYPNGDNEESLFFKILTGNYYLQPNNPLPVYYQKSSDGLTLSVWNYENEKLVFGITEILNISDLNFKNSFNFYPNPIRDIVTISSTLINYNIEVYTSLGKKIIQKKKNNTTTQLDLSNLTDGIYFIKISSNLNSFTVKLAKN